MNYSFSAQAQSTIFDFEAVDINGKNRQLREFEGKVCLITNVASKWGSTNTTYTELQELYQKYEGQGLVVLAFPSNQFGGQEPGSDSEIQKFAASKFNVTFPMFAKIPVKGSGAHPLFVYLQETLSGGILGSSIKWNFEKFLCDRNGIPRSRYRTPTNPRSFEQDIVNLLKEQKEE